MFILAILDLALAVSTLLLRYWTVTFVHYHPHGPTYLPLINNTFLCYILVASTQWLLGRTQTQRPNRPYWVSVLFGWIDTRALGVTVSSVVVNLLCVFAAQDFVYRGHNVHPSHGLSFSRTGYVDASSARVVIRAPDAVAVKIDLQPAPGWQCVTTIPIQKEADFTGTFTLDGLLADTVYNYTTNASHVGTFRTAAKSPKNFTLVSSSCMMPRFPYSPVQHSLRIQGLEYLNKFVSKHAVEFMLFLGDFIYSDLPFEYGFNKSDYQTLYRQSYASPSWTPALRSMPWLHAYDDHEIINDWSSNETGLYRVAMGPYWDYQGRANPPSQFAKGEAYFTFKHGDVAFFVLDTRRYRSPAETQDGPEKTMLGSKQLAALKQWLHKEKAWKVVVSSVPFTLNWRGWDAGDSWAGYLHERQTVFDLMRKTDGVVILSGDRHEHGTTLFPAPANSTGTPIIEFSTSPFNQFYDVLTRTYKQVEDSDVRIFDYPIGTSKFGAITFDTSNPKEWLTHFELMSYGKKVWEYDWKFEKNA